MTRRFLGRPILTADNSDPPAITQQFILQENTIIRAVRVYLINYNAPTYTGIKAKIYSVRNNSAAKEIAESTNTVLPTDVALVEDHSYREVYFEFNNPELIAGVSYQLGLIFENYTGTQASHLTWAMSYPDPPYPTGITQSGEKAANYPLHLTFIGSEV